jgi:hypothetical protein
MLVFGAEIGGRPIMKKLVGKVIYFMVVCVLVAIIIYSKEWMLLIFPLFCIIYPFREKLSAIVEKIPLSALLKYFLIGALTGLLAEYLAISSGFGFFNPNLIKGFILSIGFYGAIPIIWYFLLQKYTFSIGNIFSLGGIWGICVEQDLAILLSFDLLAYLYVFVVYGSLISIPYLLTKKHFDSLVRKEGIKKFIVAFAAQFLAYLFGFLWMAVATKITGIEIW